MMGTNKRALLGAVLAGTLLGCSGSDDERANRKLAEVEVVTQSGADTTIERYDITYSGDQLEEIKQILNGELVGRAEYAYQDGRLARQTIADADSGGQVTSDFRYRDDGQLASVTVADTQKNSREVSFSYDEDNFTKQATTKHTRPNVESTTTYNDFEYDTQGRLSRLLTISGTQTATLEIRYSENDRISRVTSFSGASLLETYEYTYTGSGRLDEITHDDDRYSLSYDEDGWITSVRHLIPRSGVTRTYNYIYAEGQVDGVYFAPSLLPLNSLIDLRGKTYTVHARAPQVDVAAISTDLPAPAGSTTPGPGPGSGVDDSSPTVPPPGGSGAQCFGQSASNSCQECMFDSCCTELETCLNNTSCSNLWSCIANCQGGAACENSCLQQYPGSQNAYYNAYWCIEDYCPSQC